MNYFQTNNYAAIQKLRLISDQMCYYSVNVRYKNTSEVLLCKNIYFKTDFKMCRLFICHFKNFYFIKKTTAYFSFLRTIKME